MLIAFAHLSNKTRYFNTSKNVFPKWNVFENSMLNSRAKQTCKQTLFLSSDRGGLAEQRNATWYSRHLLKQKIIISTIKRPFSKHAFKTDNAIITVIALSCYCKPAKTPNFMRMLLTYNTVNQR